MGLAFTCKTQDKRQIILNLPNRRYRLRQTAEQPINCLGFCYLLLTDICRWLMQKLRVSKQRKSPREQNRYESCHEGFRACPLADKVLCTFFRIIVCS